MALVHQAAVPIDRSLPRGQSKWYIPATLDPDNPTGVYLNDDARAEDIARRLWMQQRLPEIAAAHGLSNERLRQLLQTKPIVDAYYRVKKELFENVDRVLFDERAAPLLRARTQAIRAQTLVSEVLEEVRARVAAGKDRVDAEGRIIKGKPVSATMLKVGVDAAFGIMDRSKTDVAMPRGAGVAVNVNVGDGTSTFRDGTEALIRGAIGEAGIDLSDLAGGPRAGVDDETIEMAPLGDVDHVAPLDDEPDRNVDDGPTPTLDNDGHVTFDEGDDDIDDPNDATDLDDDA